MNLYYIEKKLVAFLRSIYRQKRKQKKETKEKTKEKG